jgi:hypothetical protein
MEEVDVEAPLNESNLARVLQPLFLEDGGKGLILEGFPRTQLECESAISGGWIPDAVLVLRTTNEVLSARLVPAMLKDNPHVEELKAEMAFEDNPIDTLRQDVMALYVFFTFVFWQSHDAVCPTD